MAVGSPPSPPPPSPPPAPEVCVLATSSQGAGRCPLTAGPWLEQAPRGAYTTVRTVSGSAIFGLSFHIARLASSVQLMMAADEAAGLPGAAEARRRHADLTDAALLRPAVMQSLRSAVTGYREATGDARAELKLTVLVTWLPGPDGVDISTHASLMGPRPAPPVKVRVCGAPRSNAAAKDSEWCRQRKRYERNRPSDVNEVLLADADGAVLEGLTSNFFAVLGGALHTAGEGILLGSMREATVRVAARQGIPVVLQAPRLADLASWEAAFISSTSRLLVAVDELSAPGAHPPLRRTFQRTALVDELEAGVAAEVAACSEPIFE